jgi:hypothetical protein
MSVPSSTVAFFRDQWATRFVDTCIVSRVTGTAFNETTGQTEPTTAQVYSGGCLARPASASESDFGETRRQEVDYDVYLPFDAAALQEGDKVTVTSTLDPVVPVLTVLRGFSDSYLTKQHYETKVVE